MRKGMEIMSSLYKIQSQIQQILDIGFVIDEETGEVLADASELDALILAEEEKLENVILYRKNLIAEAELIKAEEKALAARRKAKENRAKSLDDYISSCIKSSGRDKFETAKCKASFRKSKAVEIDNTFFESAPDDLLRIKKEPDKPKIKKLLQSGETVKGAVLVERESLQVK